MNDQDRAGEAVYAIAKNCERILSQDLRATFLGERDVARDLLVIGTSGKVDMNHRLLRDWVEVWDYVGNNRFYGFIVDYYRIKSFFVCFEPTVIGKDLKLGQV